MTTPEPPSSAPAPAGAPARAPAGGPLPTRSRAESLLRTAARRNPGPWVDHVRVAAGAARALAAHLPGMDPDAAYILGLLHDIGRGSGGPGVADVRHILDGFALLGDAGYPGAARICLTHSFPIKDVDAFASAWDCPPREKRAVQDYLDGLEYDDYDRLIQLCDALSLPSGPCLLEKRLVDVALRHGVNALTVDKWRAFGEIRRDVEARAGTSVYRLLPGVVATTFGFDPGGAGGAGGRGAPPAP
jgi:hypothetical protein